ncbi:MAG: hypothetical protein CBC55_03545 [Gammaproteobacteria bacterium TMED95]|nr:MAG: hypothetical protein CBC55_03545 [Gammaproteobacteria bacterium TMED95]
MPIPAFFYTDSSLERGFDTAADFASEISSNGYEQACIVDYNTMASSIRFIDSAKEAKLGAVIGFTASVFCEERDNALWDKSNKSNWLKLHDLFGGSPKRSSVTDNYINSLRLKQALSSCINSTTKSQDAIELLESVLGQSANILEDASLFASLKKIVKAFDSSLPCGELTFIATSLEGYKNLLKLNSCFKRITTGSDTFALPKEDVLRYQKDILVVDALCEKSYLSAYIDQPERAQTTSLYDVIDALGLPLYASQEVIDFLLQQRSMIVPFTKFSYACKQDYDAFCAKTAIQRKCNVNSFVHGMPRKERCLVPYNEIDKYYRSIASSIGASNYREDYWDNLGNTPVCLGKPILPDYTLSREREPLYQDILAKDGLDGGVTGGLGVITAPEALEDVSLSTEGQDDELYVYLRKLAFEGLQERLGQRNPSGKSEENATYRKRLEAELTVVREKQLASYFLIYWDIVSFARKSKVVVSFGKGKVVGSLLAYCLEITDIDPVFYALRFEGLFNAKNTTVPDIQMDIGRGREKIVAYINEKYRRVPGDWPSTCQIVSPIRYQLKTAIASVRSAFGLSSMFDKELKGLVKKAEQDLGIASPRSITWPELLASESIQKRISKEPMLARVLKIARTLTGKLHSCSIDSGSTVLSPGCVADYLPLWYDDEGKAYSLYDKKDIERIGLAKINIAHLKTLDVISECISQINNNQGKHISYRQIPMNDPSVYAMLCQQMLTDVFQLGGYGARQLVANVLPQNIDDISVLIALNRPGMMQSGVVSTYLNVKNGLKAPQYDHAALESVTAGTFGCYIFHEQIIDALCIASGCTSIQAHKIAQAMEESDTSALQVVKDSFINHTLDYWRPSYLTAGKDKKLDFALDIIMIDCSKELEHLGLGEALTADGYISSRKGFITVLKKLVNLDKEAVSTLESRIDDYRYNISHFKSDYMDAIKLCVTNGLRHTRRSNEVFTRIFLSLTQYVRFNQLFNKLSSVSSYVTDKSSLTASSKMTYITAWLKNYYPAEFYSSAMTFNKIGELYDTVVEAAQKNGIKITPPHINASGLVFRAETDKRIRYGLAKIGSIGSTAEQIVAERSQNGVFLSVYDLLYRLNRLGNSIAKPAFTSLVVAGGFDSLIPKKVLNDPKKNGREFMLWLRDRVINNVSFKRGEEASSLHDLLDAMSHVEFFAYLTSLAGATYTKKIVKNVSLPSSENVKGLFRQLVTELLVLPRVMPAKKSTLSPYLRMTFIEDFRIALEKEASHSMWKRPRWTKKTATITQALDHNIIFERQIDGMTMEKPGLGVDFSRKKLIGVLYQKLGEQFYKEIVTQWVAKMHLSYKRIEKNDDVISAPIQRLQSVTSTNMDIKIASSLLLKKVKTPFERQFLYVLDKLVHNAPAELAYYWDMHLNQKLSVSPAETINKERDACGFYITSTPVKILNIAQRVEREPPGELIDGCPMRIGLIDGSLDGQSVTTYGVIRNVVVKRVNDEGSHNFGEKLMFFDLEDGADYIACCVYGNKPVKIMHEKIIKNGVVAMVSGKISMNSRGLFLQPTVVKRYYPIEDATLCRVPKNM